jgi:hypothetical protein
MSRAPPHGAEVQPAKSGNMLAPTALSSPGANVLVPVPLAGVSAPTYAPERRYRSFISYKHQRSRIFAERIETALKAYAKPLLQPPIRIFRDERHLRPGINLPTLIHVAWSELDANGEKAMIAVSQLTRDRAGPDGFLALGRPERHRGSERSALGGLEP